MEGQAPGVLRDRMDFSGTGFTEVCTIMALTAPEEKARENRYYRRSQAC